MKVLKFGGTSMANAAAIDNVKNIVKADKANRFVVVSAPGKRESADIKVTDLLYAAFDEKQKTGMCDAAFTKVEKRFNDIIADLNIKLDLSADFIAIKKAVNDGADADYTASRGEYLSAKVCAAYFNMDFIDASDLIVFDEQGKFMPEPTNEKAKKRLAQSKGAVIPGFYGAMPNGTIKTFSRGGSDVTGSIIARAVTATVYENWTDVDGFMTCDPRIVSSACIIDMLTYKELRELSYMGASVLHSDCIFPVRKNDIPIHIRNTFNPSCKGTYIVPTKKFLSGDFKRVERTVTGIAGKKCFAAVYIEKSMMHDELGFARKVLSVLERHKISMEQMPSGIDTVTVLFDASNVSQVTLDAVMADIKTDCAPDNLQLVTDIALIAVVGHGMSRKKGTAAKLCSALSKANINIRLIDQGSSELNIIVGVESTDFEIAIKALHDEFKDD